MAEFLTPERALIFRIVHRANLQTMLDDGLHCRNSQAAMKLFVQIGNPDLIDRRQTRVVECPPGGVLSDYVPFYFTPFTPMMFNIKTGYNGITKRPNEDIMIFVSSLHRLVTDGICFVFSDRHAYLKLAQFTNDLKNLDWIDWVSLKERNFKKDDIDRFERYQAEALVHEHMPISSLAGIVCYNSVIKSEVEAELQCESSICKCSAEEDGISNDHLHPRQSPGRGG